MNITSKQCEEFKKNPKVNPLTGRKISIGKITHQKLNKACNGSYVATKHVAPPMGPMMHWRMNNDEDTDMLKFLTHIKNRMMTIDKNTDSLSALELHEFIDIFKEAHQIYSTKPKILDGIKKLYSRVNYFLRNRTIIEDRPKSKIIYDRELKSDRYSIRESILGIYSRYNSSLRTIENAIKTQTIFETLDSGVIRDLKAETKYFDYLIKHNIFSYDDIYKHTFKSEKVFDELAEEYKKYREIFKKVKGRSPL
jgi:hypothetical protein